MNLRGLTLAVLLGACGNGHSGPDAGSDGGAIDAVSIDAQDRCQTLCMCTQDFCSDDFDACLTQCAGLDDSVLECRIEHCGYAQTNPGFHCPHALGDETAPGIPQACIQP